MSQNQIEEIELNITEAKKLVAMGNSLERLISNRDFKKIVLDEYLEREAVRLVHLKGDSNMQGEESQKLILTQIDAISAFTMFLNKLQQQARLAAEAIRDGEEVLDELRAEDPDAELEA